MRTQRSCPWGSELKDWTGRAAGKEAGVSPSPMLRLFLCLWEQSCLCPESGLGPALSRVCRVPTVAVSAGLAVGRKPVHPLLHLHESQGERLVCEA